MDLIDIMERKPSLSGRVPGNFTTVPSKEVDWGLADAMPKYVPLDPDHIKISPPDHEESWMEYAVSENGTFLKGETYQASSQDQGRVWEEEPDEFAAYKEILSYYHGAMEGQYDEEALNEAGIYTAMVNYGFPGNGYLPEELGYLYFDIDSDGVSELLIIYMEGIQDIYGFDGTKAVYAYGCPYRGEAFLHTDGTLEEFYGTNTYASVTWYRMNGSIGRLLPVADRTYSPVEHEEEDDHSEYHVFAAEGEWEQIEQAYWDSGEIPVWAYEWGDVISKAEYEGYASLAPEVHLPDAKPFENSNNEDKE